MKSSGQFPAVGAATVGTGAALTAAVASACCVGPALAPVFVSILGASGLIAVSALRPYTGLLLLGSALMLAFSFRQLFSKTVCAASGARSSFGTRLARVVVYAAAFLWCISAMYAVYGLFHE